MSKGIFKNDKSQFRFLLQQNPYCSILNRTTRPCRVDEEHERLKHIFETWRNKRSTYFSALIPSLSFLIDYSYFTHFILSIARFAFVVDDYTKTIPDQLTNKKLDQKWSDSALVPGGTLFDFSGEEFLLRYSLSLWSIHLHLRISIKISEYIDDSVSLWKRDNKVGIDHSINQNSFSIFLVRAKNKLDSASLLFAEDHFTKPNYSYFSTTRWGVPSIRIRVSGCGRMISNSSVLVQVFPSFLFFYSFRENHVLIELPPLLKFIHSLRRYWIWMAYLAYFLMLWPVDDERVLDSLSYLCRTIASIQSYLYIAMQLEMHPFRIVNPVF